MNNSLVYSLFVNRFSLFGSFSFSFIKMANDKEKKISTIDKVKKWLMSFHLPIFLILAIGIGILLPQPGILYE